MTKRQLGIIFILAGVAAVVGMFVLDFAGAGQFQGIGPTQQLALVGAGIAIVIGIILLPLGDRPA